MYVFIINPIAGNGRAKRVFSKLITSQLFKKLNSVHYFTEYEGHAEKIVRNITIERSTEIIGIIVVGGDGTLHEVVNGLKDKNIPVSVIPSGSGNDFARGCSINGSPTTILKRIVQRSNPTSYWLGEYETNQSNTRFFANNIGFGFDAEIVKTANRSFYKKILNTLKLGRISYLIALIQVVMRFKPITVEVEVNGKSCIIHDCWMVSVANHPYYGGGMKVLPLAKIQPLKFPVLFIKSLSKFKLLSLFMTVFTGDHIKFKEVEIIETTKITITSTNNCNLTFQVDGEISTCRSCTIRKQMKPIQIEGSMNVSSIDKKVNLNH